MISQGFRTYDIEDDDFPITFTASTDFTALPELAPVVFIFQDVTTGRLSSRKQSFKKGGENKATLVLKAPPTPCNIVFAVQVRFAAITPIDMPLKLLFVSSDDQKAKDEIRPEDKPLVFANYVMHFR
jgi:hypothetical protein